jgi:hypothetical protein
VTPRDDEPLIVKHQPNAFLDTPLADERTGPASRTS